MSFIVEIGIFFWDKEELVSATYTNNPPLTVFAL